MSGRVIPKNQGVFYEREYTQNLILIQMRRMYGLMKGKAMNNEPLIQPYFWGGVWWLGGDRLSSQDLSEVNKSEYPNLPRGTSTKSTKLGGSVRSTTVTRYMKQSNILAKKTGNSCSNHWFLMGWWVHVTFSKVVFRDLQRSQVHSMGNIYLPSLEG